MSTPLIELRQASRYFDKGPQIIRAVDQVSLSVCSGDFVAIQGPSGCGKSTLLHLIGALDRPTSGQVLIGGHDLAQLRDRELARLRNRRVGFVFQAFNLCADLDVLRNVALPLAYAGVGRRERERRSEAALATVRMSHRLQHRPSELSGGEEQRVAIARALVNQPDVVLADEPSGNLDSSNRDAVLELLRDLNAGGQTLVVVTHDPVLALTARRRLTMEDGHIKDDPLVTETSTCRVAEC